MKKQKVLVAMSGGVDSSTAAALLLRQGYEVIGVTMQIWPKVGSEEDIARYGGCCSLEAAEDARKVAQRLGIPHYMMNFREIFHQKVISDFCQEYKRGRTPNPCIRCNQYIKFELLLQRAKELNAKFVATGHYAQIEYDEARKRFILKKGLDLKKDQSYVLYTMTQEQLAHTLMPLGRYKKDKIRQIAKDLKLPVASKPESQEICFIPDRDYRKFVLKYLRNSLEPGPILDKNGKVLGEHKGIIFYTIGQRKAIGIPSSRPLYVLKIDSQNNAIIVGPEEELYNDGLIAEQVNFIAIETLKAPLKVKARIRYNMPEDDARIYPLQEDKVYVKFERPQRAITPGQAVVFYDGDIVIGGGTIHQAAHKKK